MQHRLVIPNLKVSSKTEALKVSMQMKTTMHTTKFFSSNEEELTAFVFYSFSLLLFF